MIYLNERATKAEESFPFNQYLSRLLVILTMGKFMIQDEQIFNTN